MLDFLCLLCRMAGEKYSRRMMQMKAKTKKREASSAQSSLKTAGAPEGSFSRICCFHCNTGTQVKQRACNKGNTACICIYPLPIFNPSNIAFFHGLTLQHQPYGLYMLTTFKTVFEHRPKHHTVLGRLYRHHLQAFDSASKSLDVAIAVDPILQMAFWLLLIRPIEKVVLADHNPRAYNIFFNVPSRSIRCFTAHRHALFYTGRKARVLVRNHRYIDFRQSGMEASDTWVNIRSDVVFLALMKLVSVQYAGLNTREWLSLTSACNNLMCSRKDDPTRLIMGTELPHDTWRQGWEFGDQTQNKDVVFRLGSPAFVLGNGNGNYGAVATNMRQIKEGDAMVNDGRQSGSVIAQARSHKMAGRNAMKWADAGVSESLRDMWYDEHLSNKSRLRPGERRTKPRRKAPNGEEQELPGTEGAEVTDSGPPSRLAPGVRPGGRRVTVADNLEAGASINQSIGQSLLTMGSGSKLQSARDARGSIQMARSLIRRSSARIFCKINQLRNNMQIANPDPASPGSPESWELPGNDSPAHLTPYIQNTLRHNLDIISTQSFYLVVSTPAEEGARSHGPLDFWSLFSRRFSQMKTSSAVQNSPEGAEGIASGSQMSLCRTWMILNFAPSSRRFDLIYSRVIHAFSSHYVAPAEASCVFVLHSTKPPEDAERLDPPVKNKPRATNQDDNSQSLDPALPTPSSILMDDHGEGGNFLCSTSAHTYRIWLMDYNVTMQSVDYQVPTSKTSNNSGTAWRDNGYRVDPILPPKRRHIDPTPLIFGSPEYRLPQSEVVSKSSADSLLVGKVPESTKRLKAPTNRHTAAPTHYVLLRFQVSIPLSTTERFRTQLHEGRLILSSVTSLTANKQYPWLFRRAGLPIRICGERRAGARLQLGAKGIDWLPLLSYSTRATALHEYLSLPLSLSARLWIVRSKRSP
ncbi:hypothetical protein CCUS01_17190 [Colletotrichum cuscutae]|uniref:Uncharacterized protein n=1 Tax=Colletotrichum cuscutae TaxID=1209917 RepID=A0AAI9Y432_9PEZI|nr:hypothetical protein CCUS01_17190 [Colletotrichum cuscutae]